MSGDEAAAKVEAEARKREDEVKGKEDDLEKKTRRAKEERRGV